MIEPLIAVTRLRSHALEWSAENPAYATISEWSVPRRRQVLVTFVLTPPTNWYGWSKHNYFPVYSEEVWHGDWRLVTDEGEIARVEMMVAMLPDPLPNKEPVS